MPVRVGRGFPESGERARRPFHNAAVRALAAACAVVVGWAFTASADIPASAYVQDGLINQWDGIDNAGTGTHDPSATVWKDLKGSLDFELTSKGSWVNGLALAVNNGCAAKAASATSAYRAIEVVYKMTAASGRILFASGCTSGGNRRWVLFDHVTGYSELYVDGVDSQIFARETIETDKIKMFAANYGNNDIVSSIATNGQFIVNPSKQSNNWNIGDGKAMIGDRAAAGTTYKWTGEVYAIRLYDRPLTVVELLNNAAVDKMRFLGMSSEEAYPDGIKVEDGKLYCRVTASVGVERACGVRMNGGAAAGAVTNWLESVDGEVTFTAEPAFEMSFKSWTGDVQGLDAAELTSPTITLRGADFPRNLVATFTTDFRKYFDITVPSKAGVNAISAYDEFGAAIALSAETASADKLFSDKNDSGGFNPNIKYATKADYPHGIFVEYDITDGDAYAIKGYSVQTRTGGNNPGLCAPKSWTFWGSPDAEGDNWVLLDTRSSETGWVVSERRYYAITCGAEDAAKVYRRFKWNFTEHNGNKDFFCNLNQLEIFTTEHYFVEGDPVRYGHPSPDYGHYRAAEPVVQEFSIADVLTTDEVDGRREWRLAEGVRSLYEGWTYVDGETPVDSDATSETTSQIVQPGLRTFTWCFSPVQNRLILRSSGGGTVAIDGGDAANVCTNWFAPETTVRIRAVADPGYAFLAWGGAISDATDPSQSETVCAMSTPREITATFVSTQHDPVDTTWIGAGTGSWNDPANWSAGAIPGYGDRVYLTDAAEATTIKMEGAVPHLSRLVVSNRVNKAVTLRTSGWMTKIDADEVVIGKNGTITCAGTNGVRPFPNEGPSNRVWIVCQNLTIDKGGVIDVDGAGWGFHTTTATGSGAGPGGGPSYCGGAYGGHGGVSGTGTGAGQGHGYLPRPYGDYRHPRQPGSAGGRTNTGYVHGAGGAVLVEATGHVTVDGTITAVGDTGSSSSRGTCSGGGIEIDCETISGSGTVRAPSAGNGSPSTFGGGGRIAVHYDVAKQKLFEKPTISFDVSSGSQYGQNQKTLQYHNTSQPRGECGTVYFPDDQLLQCDPINVSGQIYMDEPKWSVPSLGIYDRTVMFPQDGFELTVAGNVVISGGVTRAAALYVGGARLVSFATNRSGGENGFRRCGWTDEPCRFTVGGSLHLGRFAECVINSAATDAALTDVPDAAYVDVGGTIRIDADAAFWCTSHPYLGGSPRVRCRKLVVAKGGKITASGEGYLGGIHKDSSWGALWYDASVVGADLRANAYGFGPGAYVDTDVQTPRAGSHGGFAASVSKEKYIYDSEERPCMPGSGGQGGSTMLGGIGGGVVWVEASRAIEIYGTVSSDGWKICGQGNQGAGGSVFLSTRHLTVDSDCTIVTRGTEGGGGGRIALWRIWDEPDSLQGDELEAKPLATSTNTSGGNGTVFFGRLPAPGLTILVR